MITRKNFGNFFGFLLGMASVFAGYRKKSKALGYSPDRSGNNPTPGFRPSGGNRKIRMSNWGGWKSELKLLKYKALSKQMGRHFIKYEMRNFV